MVLVPAAATHFPGSACIPSARTVLLLGSSGFSTYAGLFSCGLKIGAADTGVSRRANVTLPMRHIFFASSLTARTASFMEAAGAQARSTWMAYWTCKRDPTCRPQLCSAKHLVDPRWTRSALGQRAIADVAGMQWRPPPPLITGHAKADAAGFASATASSPALSELWATCSRAATPQPTCLRQSWSRNLSAFIAQRKRVGK